MFSNEIHLRLIEKHANGKEWPSHIFYVFISRDRASISAGDRVRPVSKHNWFQYL